MTRIKRLKASDMFAAVYKGGGVKQYCRIMLHKSMAETIGIRGHKAPAYIEFDQATGKGFIVAAEPGQGNCRAAKAGLQAYRNCWAFNVPHPSGTPMPRRHGRVSLPVGRSDKAEFVLDGAADRQEQKPAASGQLPLEQRPTKAAEAKWVVYRMNGKRDSLEMPLADIIGHFQLQPVAEDMAQKTAEISPPGSIITVACVCFEAETQARVVTRTFG